MVVGAGCHGQRVHLDQLIATVAVQLLFHPAQQEGGNQSHGQIAHHLHGGGGEIEIAGAHGGPVSGEEIREADNEHDGGVLHVDDEIVSNLGHDVPQGLGQDDAGHGLDVGHADGLGALSLAGVNGDNAAADGLRHVGAGVDGDHQDGGGPDVGELHGIVREIGQAVVHEHRLQHHGSAAEHLHIDPDDDADQPQEEALSRGIVLGAGNGVQNTADKTDQAADDGGHQRQDQGVPHAGDIGGAVFAPQFADVGRQLDEFIHGEGSLLYGFVNVLERG